MIKKRTKISPFNLWLCAAGPSTPWGPQAASQSGRSTPRSLLSLEKLAASMKLFILNKNRNPFNIMRRLHFDSDYIFSESCSIWVLLHILLLLFSYLIKQRFHSYDYTFAKSWDLVSILKKFFLDCHALDALELCDSRWQTMKTTYKSVQKPNSWTVISLRFLGIILRVLRFEVSVWISYTVGKGVWEGGMVFYKIFLLSPLQCTVTEL